MKKLAIFTLVAAFAAFAWLSLPGLDQVQTANGTGLLQHVDKDEGVVTISHDPLPALNTAAMTMSYAVKDRGQLIDLQPLQKVEFRLSYDGRDYVVTEIRGP